MTQFDPFGSDVDHLFDLMLSQGREFHSDPDWWAHVQASEEHLNANLSSFGHMVERSFDVPTSDFSHLHPGLRDFVAGKIDVLRDRASTNPDYDGAYGMARLSELTSHVNQADPQVVGSSNYHSRDSAVRWANPASAQLPFTDASGGHSSLGFGSLLDQMRSDPDARPFNYSFTQAEDGSPVARLVYPESAGHRADSWDIRIEANTGTPFMGRTGSSYAYGITASMGFVTEERNMAEPGRSPFMRTVNAPGAFHDVGDNLREVINRPTGDFRAFDSYRPGESGAQGFNLNMLGSGQLVNLGSGVSIPSWGANGYAPTDAENDELRQAINSRFGDSRSYVRRSGTETMLFDAFGAQRHGATTFLNDAGEESSFVYKGEKDLRRATGGATRGITGSFGLAMGQEPMIGTPIAKPEGRLGTGANLSNMVAWVQSGRLGLGEGAGLVESGHFMIENYKQINVEGRTPDQLEALGIRSGNVYGHSGRLPNGMLTGDTFMGNTRQIEGLDYNPGNHQFTRIGGMVWNEGTHSTVLSIGQGDLGDQVEYKTSPGTKAMLQPVGENDPRLLMGRSAAQARGIGAPSIVVPMDTNQQRWNADTVEMFRLHEQGAVGYVNDMISAGASMGFTADQVQRSIRSVSPSGTTYGSMFTARGADAVLAGRGMMSISGDMAPVEQIAALRYAESRMQTIAQEPVPVENWKVTSDFEAALRNRAPGFADEQYRQASADLVGANRGGTLDPASPLASLYSAGQQWQGEFFNSMNWVSRRDHQEDGYWLAGWNERVLVHQMVGSPLAVTSTGKSRFGPEQLTNLAENDPAMYAEIARRRDSGELHNPYADLIQSARANLGGGTDPAALALRAGMNPISSEDIDLSSAMAYAQSQMPNGTQAQYEELAYAHLAQSTAGRNIQIGDAIFSTARTASSMYTVLDGEDANGVPTSRTAKNYASKLMNALTADAAYRVAQNDPTLGSNQVATALEHRNTLTSDAMGAMLDLANSDNTQLEAMRTTVEAFAGPVVTLPGLNASWAVVNAGDFQHLVNQRGDLDDAGKQALMDQFRRGESVGVNTMFPQTTRHTAYGASTYKSADWVRRTQPGMSNAQIPQGGIGLAQETISKYAKDADGDLIAGIIAAGGLSGTPNAKQELQRAWQSRGGELGSIQAKLANVGMTDAQRRAIINNPNLTTESANSLNSIANGIRDSQVSKKAMALSYVPLINDAGDVARINNPNAQATIEASDRSGAQVYQLALDKHPSQSAADNDLISASYNMTLRTFDKTTGDVRREAAIIAGPDTKYMGRHMDDRGVAGWLFDRIATAQMAHSDDAAENQALYFGNGGNNAGIMADYARTLIRPRDQGNVSVTGAVTTALTDIFNAGGLNGLQGTAGTQLRANLLNAINGTSLDPLGNPQDIDQMFVGIENYIYGAAGETNADRAVTPQRVSASIGRNTIRQDARSATRNGTPLHYATEADATAPGALPGLMGHEAQIGQELEARHQLGKKENRVDVEEAVRLAGGLHNPLFDPLKSAVGVAFGTVPSSLSLRDERGNILRSIEQNGLPPAPPAPVVVPPSVAAPLTSPGTSSLPIAPSSPVAPKKTKAPRVRKSKMTPPPTTPPGVPPATPVAPGTPATPPNPPTPPATPTPAGPPIPPGSPLSSDIPLFVTHQGVVGGIVPGSPDELKNTVALRVQEPPSAPALQKIIESGAKIDELRQLTQMVSVNPALGSNTEIASRISTLFQEINPVFQQGEVYYRDGGTANKAEYNTHFTSRGAGAVITAAQNILPDTAATTARQQANQLLDRAFPSGQARSVADTDIARLKAYGGAVDASGRLMGVDEMIRDLRNPDLGIAGDALHTSRLILGSEGRVRASDLEHGTSNLPPGYTSTQIAELREAADFVSAEMGVKPRSPAQRARLAEKEDAAQRRLAGSVATNEKAGVIEGAVDYLTQAAGTVDATGFSPALEKLRMDAAKGDPGAVYQLHRVQASLGVVNAKDSVLNAPAGYDANTQMNLGLAYQFTVDQGYKGISPTQDTQAEQKRIASLHLDGPNTIEQATAHMDAFNTRLKDMGQILTGVTKGQDDYIRVAQNMLKIFDEQTSNAERVRSIPTVERTPDEQRLLNQYDKQVQAAPGITAARQAVAKAQAQTALDLPDEEEYNRFQLTALLGARNKRGTKMRDEALARGDYDDYFGIGSASQQRAGAQIAGGVMRGFETLTSPSTMFMMNYGLRMINDVSQGAQEFQNLQASDALAQRTMGGVNQAALLAGVYGTAQRQQGLRASAQYNRQKADYAAFSPFLELEANLENSGSGLANLAAIGEGALGAGILGTAAAGVAVNAFGVSGLGAAGVAGMGGIAATIGLPIAAIAAGGLAVATTASYRGKYYDQGGSNFFAKAGGAFEALGITEHRLLDGGDAAAGWDARMAQASYTDQYHQAIDHIRAGADFKQVMAETLPNGQTFEQVYGSDLARADNHEQWKQQAISSLGIAADSTELGALTSTLGMFDPMMQGAGGSGQALTNLVGQQIKQGFNPAQTALNAAAARNISLGDTNGMLISFQNSAFALAGQKNTNYGQNISPNQLIAQQQISQADTLLLASNTARYGAGQALRDPSYFVDLAAGAGGPMGAQFQAGVDQWAAQRLIDNPLAVSGQGMEAAVRQATDPRKASQLMKMVAPENYAALAQQWSYSPQGAILPGLTSIQTTIGGLDQWKQLGPDFQAQALGLAARAGLDFTNSLSQGNNMNVFLGANEQLFGHGLDPMTIITNRLAEQGLAPTNNAISRGAKSLAEQMRSGQMNPEDEETYALTSKFVTTLNNSAALAGRAAPSLPLAVRGILKDSPEAVAALGTTRGVGDTLAMRQDGFMTVVGSQFDKLDNLALFDPTAASRQANQIGTASALYQNQVSYGANPTLAALNLGALGMLDAQQFNTGMLISQGDPRAVSKNYKQLGRPDLRTMNVDTGMDINYQNLDSAAIGVLRASDAGFGYIHGDVTDADLAMGERGWQNKIRTSSRSLEAFQYQQQTQQRNLGYNLLTGNMAGASAIFGAEGMTLDVGNGMGFRQIEDVQRSLSREQQDFSLTQQGQQLGIQRQQFALSGTQFAERQALSQQQINASVAYQRADMNISREHQVASEGWQEADLAYNRAQTEVQYGWQQEDFARNIRYARGREKRDLMREQSRSTVEFAMQEGHQSDLEGRQKTQEQWSKEEFDRRKNYFEQTTHFQQAELDMQKKHFDEGRVLEQQSLDLQKQNHDKQLQWEKEGWMLEDQQRKLERQSQDIQFQMETRMAEAVRASQLEVQKYSDLMAASNTQLQLAGAQLGVLAANGSLTDAYLKAVNPALGNFITLLGNLYTTLTKNTLNITPPPASNATPTPGVIGVPNTQPGHGHANGGYTGDGTPGNEDAGTVGYKEFVVPPGGAAVVPENGALVLHTGNNTEVTAKLDRMLYWLEKIAGNPVKFAVNVATPHQQITDYKTLSNARP